MSDQFRIVVNDRLVDIGDLKVAELKVELKKRGISVTGNKQELVDKLKNYLMKSQEHQQAPVPQFIPQAQVQFQSPQKLNQSVQFQPQQHHQSPEQFHHQFMQQQQQPQLQQSPQQIAFAANNFNHIQHQQQLQHEVLLQQQLLQQQQQQNFLNQQQQQQQQFLNNNFNNGTNSFPVDSYENPIIAQTIPHNEENHLNTDHSNAHEHTNNIQQVEMNDSVTHAVQEPINNHVVLEEPEADTRQMESQPVVEEQKELVHEESRPVEVEPEPVVQQESNQEIQDQPQDVSVTEPMDQENKPVEHEEMPRNAQQTEENKENKKEEESHVSSEEQTNKVLDISSNELNDSSKLNESVDAGQNGDLPKLQRKRKWLNNEAANILTNKKSLTISSDTLKTYLPTPPANQDEEHKITASSTEPETKQSQTHVATNRDVQLEDNELIYEDALSATNNSNTTSQAEIKQEESIVVKTTPATTVSPSKRPISNVLHVSNLTRPFTLPQLKELLSKYGRILCKDSKDYFWINPVKSHCYVAFEKEEEARLAREALHNTSWPQSNPKQLHIEYSKMDELVLHMNSDKPVPLAPSSKTSSHEKSSSAVNGSEKSHEPKESSDTKAKREQASTKTSSVREWDLPKLNRGRSRSPVKERHHTSSTGPGENKKEKPVSANNKPGAEQEKQQPKTLDDLFRKTKTAPFIYWLPLTEEQYLERQKEHEKRMADRLKRAEERKAREAAVTTAESERTVAPEAKAETAQTKTEGEKEAGEAANNRVRERETASEKEKIERDRQREKDRERERIRERERERERERDRMRETDRYRDREREREREMRERQREREIRDRERERRRSPPTSYRRSSRDRYESRPTRRRSPSTASSRSSSSRSSSSGSSSGSSRSTSRSSRSSSSSSSNSSRSRSSSASSNGSKRENENKKKYR